VATLDIPKEKPSVHITNWIALAISVISAGFTCLTYLNQSKAFSDARENLRIERSIAVPRATLEEIDGKPVLGIEYSLSIINLSTSPAPISSIKCESGSKAKPYDIELRSVSASGCSVFEVVAGSHKIVDSYVNINPKSTVELRVVAKFDAAPKTLERYSKYKMTHAAFDDEAFLLYLAEMGEDYFGNRLGIPHHYLEVSIGRGLCLGGSFEFSAATESRTIKLVEDFYLGRIAPVSVCDDRRVPVIDYRSPFRSDLWNTTEPL
jgi:hypothetical protein